MFVIIFLFALLCYLISAGGPAQLIKDRVNAAEKAIKYEKMSKEHEGKEELEDLMKFYYFKGKSDGIKEIFKK